MKRFAIALAASLVGFPALAADMSVKSPLAPLPIPSTVFNWNGCYVDMTAGAMGGANQNGSPAAGGGMGCNFQQAGSPWVIGVEGSMIGTDTLANLTNLANLANIKALGDFGVRVGYALSPNLALGPVTIKNALPYLKVSGAAVDMTTPLSGSAWKGGVQAAGGVEIPIMASALGMTTMRYQVDATDINGKWMPRYTATVAMYGSPM